MSMDDRDWMREPEPRSFGLGRLPPWGILAAATVAAFIVQQAVANGSEPGAAFIDRHLALTRRGVLAGEAWQPITYLLLHGSLGHLFWNMVGLYCFGTYLSDFVSPRGFHLNYLVGGLSGAAACLLLGREAPVVGASGAVLAVAVAAALRSPRAPIRLLFLPMPLPLWLLVAFYVAGDLISAVLQWTGGGSGGIAVEAHLGGAVGAALLFALSRARGPGRPPAPRRARREEFDEENVLLPVGQAREAAEEERVAARVDALLDRIHSGGMGSLSDEEKEFLKRASERYRGRRK